MDEITAVPADGVPDLQRTVQRKFGRCMLLLQQYEKLLKAMVSQSELSGPVDRLQAIRERKIGFVQQQTMGTLVKMLTEGYMSSPVTEEKLRLPEAHTGSQNWASFRNQIELPSERYERTKAALKELVVLRNAMAHHFIDRFDLWSASGCLAADAFLEESHQTIHEHYLDLHDWAKTMSEAQTAMAMWLNSQDCEDMLDRAWADAVVDG